MSVLKSLLVVVIAILTWQYFIRHRRKTNLAPQISGYVHPSFQKVADVFRNNLESGLEHGAAFSVHYKGNVLIDLWGGWSDLQIERPWEEDTLTLVYSVVKGATAIVIARLVDMGLLDYKKEVYRYWPEFGTNDEKKNITVEMLLSHRAGLIGLDEKITVTEYRDNWDRVEKLLSSQNCFWPPGSASGYHLLTMGMYADALVRKVDPQHRNLSQFFNDEIAQPLDIEFYIGLPKHLYYRFARTLEAPFWEFRYGFMSILSMLTSGYFYKSIIWDAQGYQFNNPDLLNVGHPSVMGVSSARSVAKMYDYLANGGAVKAKQLLSSPLVDALREPLTEGIPRVFLPGPQYSRGMFVTKTKDNERIGHPGYGGSNAFADMTYGFGVAYTTNYLTFYLQDDPRETAIVNEFYDCFHKFIAQEPPRRGI